MTTQATEIRDTAPVFKHFKVTPTTPKIGGTIEGMHLSELNDDSAEELRQALWHYGVLFAREQHLTVPQMKKVAYCFSDELEKHTFSKRPGEPDQDPEVVVIEMVYKGTTKITTDLWHHDVTARKHPNLVGVLQAEEVPFGADTMWCSASAIYDALPYAMKLLFVNLDIDHDAAFAVLRHDFVNSSRLAVKMIELQEMNTYPAVIHHHATGRPCLFVGNGYVKRVHQYPDDLSELILKLANEMPRIPEFQVRHQWQRGDVAIWDNFGTLHYGVTSGVRGQVRRLRRVAAVSSSIRPTLDRERAMRELLQAGA